MGVLQKLANWTFLNCQPQNPNQTKWFFFLGRKDFMFRKRLQQNIGTTCQGGANESGGMRMSEASSPTPSLEFAEEEQEDIESFRQWMGFVNRCLKGRLTEEDTGANEEKEEFLDEKNESEAERNMRIARSVLDEETALDMARTFIKLTKDVDIPEVAKLNFDSCEFDAEFEQGGAYVLRTFINCYMLSRDRKLMDYPEVRITMMIERTAESTTLRKVCAIENNLPYYDNNKIL